MSSDTTNPFVDAFVQEAAELLEEIEVVILELEENASSRELLDRLFRAVHTLKGSGSMFKFTQLADFAHVVETVMDLAREGRVVFDSALAGIILRSRDLFQQLIEAQCDGTEVDQAVRAALEAELNTYLAEPKPDVEASTPSGRELAQSDAAGQQVTWVYFKPSRDIIKNGNDPRFVIEDLRAMAPCAVVADDSDLPEQLEDLDPELCYLGWDMFVAKDLSNEEIDDVFMFVADESRIEIHRLSVPAECDLEQAAREIAASWREQDGDERLGSANTFDGTRLPNPFHVEASLDTAGASDPTESVAEPLTAVPAETVAAPAPQPTAGKSAEPPAPTAKPSTAAESIRVPSPRIDTLVNLVGELVINQARLAQLAQGLGSTDMVAAVEETERLVGNLRNNVLSIRMMPIGMTFSKIKRLVRDLSQSLEKPVALSLHGSETELDKTVIDQLFDPLVHIIRNAMDHGIESPERRQQAGKPEQGTIRLEAVHEGASVVIRIQDDGGGLNADKIRQRAVERGLIAEHAQLSPEETYDLIFEPGFSTAEQVSQVSGRGVGMDVVRRRIEELRGQIHIGSEPGQGTTFSLTLPLTLAIIDGLLVEVDNDRFIIPMSLVSENVEITREQRLERNGRNLITVRGKQLPFIRLREVFDYAQTPEPDLEKVVLLDVDGGRIGFVVDRVIGTHQTVIQSLGRMLAHIHLVSGATILGDGAVALILDVPGVVKAASQQALPAPPAQFSA